MDYRNGVYLERKCWTWYKNKRENHLQQLRQFITEYVQSLQQKIDRKKARKVRLYRRLTVFAIVALLMLGYFTHSFFEQKKILR